MFGAAVGLASAIYALHVAKREEELIFGLPPEMQAKAMDQLRERRAQREREATEERRHREMVQAIDRVSDSLRYRRLDY